MTTYVFTDHPAPARQLFANTRLVLPYYLARKQVEAAAKRSRPAERPRSSVVRFNQPSRRP